MQKFRIRVDATGQEYTIEASPHVLMTRALKRGDLKVGSKLRRVSLLDGSHITETIVEIVKNAPGFTVIQHPSTYPMWSDAAGINPDQIPEAVAADRAAGFHGIEYHPDTGAVKFPDRSTRKRYCEAIGLYDRNGGYSDPQQRRESERVARAS